MTLFRTAALSLVFAVAAVAVTPHVSEARGTPMVLPNWPNGSLPLW